MKKVLIGLGILAVIGIGIVSFILLEPHRDVQNTKADASIESTQLVEEYLKDATVANNKYLADDGQSKILIISGRVHSIEKDGAGLPVVYLKTNKAKMGVNCTFVVESSEEASTLKVNDKVKIKGVIRSGASYDEDLDLYEDVIVEKCALVK